MLTVLWITDYPVARQPLKLNGNCPSPHQVVRFIGEYA
jgi:hypothetical protein